MKQEKSALLEINFSILYLSKQAIRGYNDLNSYIHQLFILRVTDVPELNDWLLRNKYKQILHDIQDKILSTLAQNIKKNLISEIKSASCYFI